MWDVWVVWRVCANEYVMLRVKKLYTGWHRFLKTFFLLFCSPVAVYLYTYTRALYIIYKCPTVLFYFFILHFKTVARTRVPGLIAGRRQPPTVVVHRAVLRVAFKIRFRFGMAARGLLHIPVRPTCARREFFCSAEVANNSSRSMAVKSHYMARHIIIRETGDGDLRKTRDKYCAEKRLRLYSYWTI
jgi:hypothetical protein